MTKYTIYCSIILCLIGCQLESPSNVKEGTKQQFLQNPKEKSPLVSKQWKEAQDNISVNSEPINADRGWLENFADKKLNKFVAEGMEKNLDLKIAATNLQKAESFAVKAGVLLKPIITIAGSSNLDKNITERANTKFAGASLVASWEIDVWGKIRAGVASAKLDLEATQLTYEYARQSLAGQIAKAYFAAVQSKILLGLGKDIIQNYQKLHKVVKTRYEIGRISKKDLHLIQADIAGAKEAYAKAEGAYKEALRSLEIALGRYPNAEIQVGKKFSAIPFTIPVGLPAELLERRPDIIAAEKKVGAAFYKTEQAKKARLPRFALTSEFGTTAQKLEELASIEQVAANFAANFSAPILDWGNLEADEKIATEEQRAALFNYNKVALNAFKDVETAITNEKILREREKYLQEVLHENNEALRLAKIQYEVGKIDLFSVLQMQIRVDFAKIDLINIHCNRLSQRVNLHLSLGGGFEPKRK